mgnify:CR=1 FL=1
MSNSVYIPIQPGLEPDPNGFLRDLEFQFLRMVREPSKNFRAVIEGLPCIAELPCIKELPCIEGLACIEGLPCIELHQ